MQSQQQQQYPPPYVQTSTVGTVQLQPVVVPAPGSYVTLAPTAASAGANIADGYRSGQSVVLGIILIIVGILAIIYDTVAICIGIIAGAAGDGQGISCGVFFIITGSFGMAARNKNRCLIITFMVLSIISAIAAFGLFALSLRSAVGNSGHDTAGVALASLLVTAAFVAKVISIRGSVICCRAVCCGSNNVPVYRVVQSGRHGDRQILVGNQHLQPYEHAYVMQAPANPAPQFGTARQLAAGNGGYMHADGANGSQSQLQPPAYNQTKTQVN
jgi:hypothetical protein